MERNSSNNVEMVFGNKRRCGFWFLFYFRAMDFGGEERYAMDFGEVWSAMEWDKCDGLFEAMDFTGYAMDLGEGVQWNLVMMVCWTGIINAMDKR